MTTEWPLPIPCWQRHCRNRAVYGVVGQHRAVSTCRQHLDAACAHVGEPNRHYQLDPGADHEPEQPDLFTDPNGDAA